jgi:predicted DNA-binding transcriptional regulator
MNKDQTIGAVILLVSVVGIAVYAWLLYAYSIVVLQVTAFIAVAGVLVILAWIGWTMATTPAPAPLEGETLSPEAQTSTAKDPAQ